MKKKDSNLNSSYDKQIGGSHYQGCTIQPSQFVIENKMLFPEGSAIKYICRHAKKDGKQDLLKAIHFIEMIIERDYKETKQESWIEGFRKWKRGTL
jgi:hypothetical protein